MIYKKKCLLRKIDRQIDSIDRLNHYFHEMLLWQREYLINDINKLKNGKTTNAIPHGHYKK
jgi:hypothetical protein